MLISINHYECDRRDSCDRRDIFCHNIFFRQKVEEAFHYMYFIRLAFKKIGSDDFKEKFQM